MTHGLLLLDIKDILVAKLFILSFRLGYEVMDSFIMPISHMGHALFLPVPFYTES